MTATATIAGIAAWASYWHMVSVGTRHGEATTLPPPPTAPFTRLYIGPDFGSWRLDS